MGFARPAKCLSCGASGALPSKKTSGDAWAFDLCGTFSAPGGLNAAVFKCRACGSFNLMSLCLISTSRFDRVVKPGEPQHDMLLRAQRGAAEGKAERS